MLKAALNNVDYGGEVLNLLVGHDIPDFDIDAEMIYGMVRISDPETVSHGLQ